MISEIVIHGPATFRSPAKISIEKKINLFYGLNGTGKTTICRYLREPGLPEYHQCSIKTSQKFKTYVYNNDFVRENFYESDTLKGIFSLSKENKEAEQKIAKAKTLRSEASNSRLAAAERLNSHASRKARCTADAHESVWDIKTRYSGGDRVLEFCLEGVKGKKESLFNKLIATPLIDSPDYTIEDLKSEAQALTKQDAKSESEFSLIDADFYEIETDPIFTKVIVGNQESTVAALIETLSNSDWVRLGMEYLNPPGGSPTQCPFCQQNTVTANLIDQLNRFFDDSYVKSLDRIEELKKGYHSAVDKLPKDEAINSNAFSSDDLRLNLEKLRTHAHENKSRLASKVLNPSRVIALEYSNKIVEDINAELRRINALIREHNNKISNKHQALTHIKDKFWSVMRFNYKQMISKYHQDVSNFQKNIDATQKEIDEHDKVIDACSLEIEQAQKETINIDEAITKINISLLNLGIDDFFIEKHNEQLYHLSRKSELKAGGKFSTLSEGEKMIITLLYFFELCKGKTGADDTTEEKVVVFDDPISSLSHLYVFNIGQLLKENFFNNDSARQVFVFTHSLYFFYELTDPNHNRRKEKQSLFRIYKSSTGSHVDTMRYEEIQNDYQAYWQVVNDEDQHPALVANCMRNIIEYFFNFVCKKDFNNVFLDNKLKENRFQAFNRYMNRESHSLGQNIFDLKEFDYTSFRDGLRIIFNEMQYGEHYIQMSKIGKSKNL
ncbi:AAA family ATPase [Xanthomonas sp. PPL568]|uniref:AAA family ATPase n=1 Tax=Xanthomonas indica TaxID=2912242 RepID=UPI001F5A4738|nr:AAA family ATPase [Xanthomonas indica]MCI2244569.1 AAA family ATPase [Xanthomonas indica]